MQEYVCLKFVWRNGIWSLWLIYGLLCDLQMRKACGSNGAVIQMAAGVRFPVEGDEAKRTCPICGKRVSHSYNLGGHIRVHTGEKPYTCPYCQYRTARKFNLNSHIIRKHRKDIDQIPPKQWSNYCLASEKFTFVNTEKRVKLWH